MNKLVRRNDPDVEFYCTELLKSDEIEEWSAGMQTLEAVGSQTAIEVLMKAGESFGDVRSSVLMSTVSRMMLSRKI